MASHQDFALLDCDVLPITKHQATTVSRLWAHLLRTWRLVSPHLVGLSPFPARQPRPPHHPTMFQISQGGRRSPIRSPHRSSTRSLPEPSRANVQSDPSALISSRAIPLAQDLCFSVNTPVFPHTYADLGDPCNDQSQLDFGVFPTPSDSQQCGAHTPPNPCEDPIGPGLLKARQRICATCAQPSQHRVNMMKDQSMMADSLWPGVPHWFHCAPCRAQLRSMMLPLKLCDHQHLYITDESLLSLLPCG